MYLRVQFFDENSNVVEPSREKVKNRIKHEEDMFNNKTLIRALYNRDEYTNEEKAKLVDQLTRRSYVDLDLSLPGDRAFFELVNFSPKVELWNGEYEIVDKVFRAIAPKALWVTVKKINKG